MFMNSTVIYRTLFPESPGCKRERAPKLEMHPCKILAMVQNHENNFPLSGSSFGTAIFIEQLFIILRQVSHPGQRATALFARCSASRQCKDV